jgi:hypothetical protein
MKETDEAVPGLSKNITSGGRDLSVSDRNEGVASGGGVNSGSEIPLPVSASQLAKASAGRNAVSAAAQREEEFVQMVRYRFGSVSKDGGNDVFHNNNILT